MKQVKVISGKYAGEIFEGHRYYYDHLHTGSSQDLFMIKTPDEDVTITSDSVDVQHYENQLLQEELVRLGANVGDMVKIIRSGSGSYKKEWNERATHIITEINSSGYVQFDNGMARMFRPDVDVIRSTTVI